MSGLQSELLAVLEAPGTPEADLRRRVLETLLAPPRPRQMTYEEFLAWADEDTLAEWVDGEVVMSTPASGQHQDIDLFLAKVIDFYVEQRELGKVRIPPFQMKLANSGREPDLIFIAREHMDRLQPTYLDGPADLVVEIISPESIGRDRGDKFYEYERASIPEYWMIDPLRERAEFYQLNAQGYYDLIMPDAEGIYRSRVLPGFWLRIAWLWHPPRVMDVLRELNLI